MPTLTNPRHEAFCMEYHKNGFNGLQAYNKVYGPKKGQTNEVNATKLLRNTKVVERLEELKAKARENYGIDMQNIVDKLYFLYEEGVTSIPIIGGKEGEIFGYKKQDLNVSLKALDSLTKIAGGYAPTKGELDLSGGVTLRKVLDELKK